ncbi:MAG: glycosyltransferase, partial [bacterium]
MRILLCNTYLYRKGGAEVSFFETADLLTRKGHEVLFFGMKDPRNEISGNSDCFVDNIRFGDYRPSSVLWNARALGRVLYSTEAAGKVRRLIQHNMPDFAYVNNIAHHISPSILDVFKECGVPVMMSVRDYKIICPNSLLLNRDGVCERCWGGKYYNALIHRCKRGSLIPSAVACLEAYLHRHKGIYDSVSAFLAPSHFCKEKLVQFGVERKKIFVVPNFVNRRSSGLIPEGSLPFCAYFGRLSKEKGLHQLIEAAHICGQRVVIVGDGELKDGLFSHAKKLGATNVAFWQRMSSAELMSVVAGSLFT